METRRRSRAERMAATYGDVLIKAGVIKEPLREIAPLPMLHEQIIRGEINWWDICLGQLPAGKK